jgi:hypothetical protein
MTPIKEPGIYDIDIDVYHTQACCDGPSVSSSGLRSLLSTCPAKFYAYSDLNPKPFKSPDRPALSLGRAAHALVLGEPEFNKKFVLSPYDDFRSKEAREWRDAQTRQVIKNEDFLIVCDMADAQRTSPQVAEALTDGKPEQSIIWQDPATGVYLKTRPDWLPNDITRRFVCEYKTALTIEPRKLGRDVFNYGYHLQAAMMLDTLQMVTGRKPLGIGHIVQEKDPPYLAELRLFTSEQLDYGRLYYRKALRLFARCLETKTWPSYTTEPQYFDTPAYVIREMENFDDEPGYQPLDYAAAI